MRRGQWVLRVFCVVAGEVVVVDSLELGTLVVVVVMISVVVVEISAVGTGRPDPSPARSYASMYCRTAPP